MAPIQLFRETKIMKHALLAFVLLATIAPVKGQEDRRPWMPLENRVGIAFGIGKHTFLDENTSPLVYQSKPKNLRLFYQLESNTVLLSVDIDMRLGTLQPIEPRNRMLVFEEETLQGEKKTKRFPAGGSFLGAKVSLGGYYKIKSTQESTFKVAAGLRIAQEVFYPQGWTVSGLMSAINFAPQAIVQHRINGDHRVTTALRLPVAAYVTRPPYHNSVSYPGVKQVQGFFKNSEWTGIQKYITPELTVSYDFRISDYWGTGITYDFAWYQVETEKRLRAESHALRANIYTQF